MVYLKSNGKGIESRVSKRYLYTHIHSIISQTAYNSQKVEGTQMFIDRWKEKQNVVYTHSGNYSVLKRKKIKFWQMLQHRWTLRI